MGFGFRVDDLGFRVGVLGFTGFEFRNPKPQNTLEDLILSGATVVIHQLSALFTQDVDVFLIGGLLSVQGALSQLIANTVVRGLGFNFRS